MLLPRWTPLLVSLFLPFTSACRENSNSSGGSAKADASAPEVSSVVSIKGIDTSALTPRERREWSAQISELLSPCPDVPVSIAQCAKEERACKACVPAAQMLLKQVLAGRTKKEREEAYNARFDTKNLRTIPTDGSPEMGAADAVVTIVEWADFECPFCKMVVPILDELTHRFEGQVRLVFKFYPLPAHTHGEIAARAGAAAHAQGKFWEMHHMLFDNQERLELADIERYAKQLGMDMPKFKADFMSAQSVERIEKDKKQADDLGLDGTPMIFVNGRKVNLESLTGNVYEDLEDWLKLDIELAGKVPRPPPPKASAAASQSAGAPAASADAPPPSTSASAQPKLKPDKK